MKLLIADDDDILRSQLAQKIPWADSGYELVGAASNGKEAYEMAMRYKPQILLTDIKMPYMNGIELVRKVREILPNCRAIFLTGYDDFAFAKEAIRLCADDYILKGEAEEVILQALNTVSENVRQDTNQIHLNELGEYLFKQDLLSQLLQGCYQRSEAEKNMRLLGLDISGYQYRIAVLKMNGAAEKNIERKPSREIRYEQELIDTVKEFLDKNLITVYSTKHQQYFVLLIEMVNASDEEIRKLFEQLNDVLIEKLGRRPMVGISRIYEQGKEFSQYFDDAVFAIENAGMEGKTIHFFQELSQSRYIHLIREYIMEHYADSELSLLSLSEELFISPAYISSLFKRYTNDNFKGYLIRFRIKKACHLLETTDYCTYEVAALVGYPNAQYFSVMLKKYMYQTPTENRASFQNGSES